MTLPVFPYPGGVQGALPPDPVAGQVGHFNWSNWIKAAVLKLDAEATPVGSIIMFGGSVAPAGWHLCNGTAHGSAALQAVIGSATTPNLMDRFIVGAGSSYAQGNAGGAALQSLNTAHMPTHDHGGYTLSAGSHTHTNPWQYYTDYNNVNQDGSLPPYLTTGRKVTIYTAGTIPVANAGGEHTHQVYAEGGGAAFDNRPPYYALTYIIKK
jgi:microcystin-dependent protein